MKRLYWKFPLRFPQFFDAIMVRHSLLKLAAEHPLLAVRSPGCHNDTQTSELDCVAGRMLRRDASLAVKSMEFK